MKTVSAIALVLLLAVSSSVWSLQDQTPEQETAWVCPMHSDYTMDVIGNCPRCGMALVRAAPFDVPRLSSGFPDGAPGCQGR